MSKVKITGNASGTGVLTVTAPDTDVDREITLPDAAGTLLTSNGDGSSLTGVGGAWTLINSQVANDDASLTQTGLDSTYDTYAIVLADLVPATDAANPWLRCGDSGGIDSGASDYEYHTGNVRATSASYAALVSDGAAQMLLAPTIGSAGGEGFGGGTYLSRPGDGSVRPFFHGTFCGMNEADRLLGSAFTGQRQTVITLDRVQFLFSSGNITSGRMTVYGIAHA